MPVRASVGARTLLFTGSVVFSLALAACLLAAPDLIRDNNLSEFGVDPRTAAIFNISLIVVGLMTLAAAWQWNGRLAWLIASLCVLAGIGMIGTGVITTNVSNSWHIFLSGADYLGHFLLLVALMPSVEGRLRLSAIFAVCLSFVFLLVWVIAPSFERVTIGQGTGQLLAVLPLLLWIMAFASQHLGRPVAIAVSAPTSGAAVQHPRRGLEPEH